MVSCLCQAYQYAVDMLEHAEKYYQNLTEQAGMSTVEKWSEDIEKAEKEQRDNMKVMDIYAAKLTALLQTHSTYSSRTSPLLKQKLLCCLPFVKGKTSGSHFLKICFRKGAATFLGILGNYISKGTATFFGSLSHRGGCFFGN